MKSESSKRNSQPFVASLKRIPFRNSYDTRELKSLVFPSSTKLPNLLEKPSTLQYNTNFYVDRLSCKLRKSIDYARATNILQDKNY